MPKVMSHAVGKKLLSSESTTGILLLACALLSIGVANSELGDAYRQLWNRSLGGHPLSHWIDDGLMAIFFLLIGLELKHEFLFGTLRSPRRSLSPLLAAVGGMLVPAAIYLMLNWSSNTWMGFGIPMATDIAFVMAVLALLGKRIPSAVKLFLMTLAVVDDLGAVLVIALFYSSALQIPYLLLAAALWGLLLVASDVTNPTSRFRYAMLSLFLAAGGVGLWILLMAAGVHATLSGILLAVAVPSLDNRPQSPASRWQKRLHGPVYWIVLPLFILANTAIDFSGLGLELSPLVVGIGAGLLLGKPLGILAGLAVARLSAREETAKNIPLRQWIGAAFLGGIGFTMSIFVTSMAFDDPRLVDSAKATIFIASALSAVIGALLLARPSRDKQSSIQKNKQL